MSTGKYKKKAQGTTNVSNRGAVHNIVVRMGDDINKNESHIPTPILIAGLVVCIVLIILIPVIGVAYMDMNNATVKAIEETRKMRELRVKILMEIQGEQ